MKTQNRRILALATTILLFFPVILAQKVSTAASLHENHQDHDHDHDEHEHQHDHGEHHEHGGGHHEEEGHGGHEKNELVSEILCEIKFGQIICHTACKLQNSLVTQILREIKVGASKV